MTTKIEKLEQQAREASRKLRAAKRQLAQKEKAAFAEATARLGSQVAAHFQATTLQEVDRLKDKFSVTESHSNDSGENPMKGASHGLSE